MLKINSSPLTITDAGGVTALADFGIELIGGSGTVALTTGDTASFSVRPPNSKSMDVVVGGAFDVVPEIGLVLYSQQRGTSEMFEIDCFRVKLSSLPFGFTKFEFATAEITAQAFYDTTRNGILSIRSITPTV